MKFLSGVAKPSSRCMSFMLNQPLSTYREPDNRPSGWELDQHPRLRLAGLYAGFALASVAIAVRLVYVQTELGLDYAGEFARTIEHREAISARDGRILSSDGQVLAEDVELFALKVHFRWLEQPVDRGWLRGQALSRLDRTARRRPEQVRAAETAVLAQRDDLWRRLERLVRVEQGKLQRERNRIQRQVARIYELVELQRADRDARDANRPSAQSPPTHRLRWEHAWQVIVSALTTPPRREVDEPLVIREQLDYHQLLSEIPRETAIEIEAHPERYPGVRIETRTRRVYPHGGTAPHVIGYRTLLDEDAVRRRRQQLPDGDPLDYHPGDGQGQTGIERQYERHLRGLRGERKIVFNRRGELIASEVVREPRHGQDLVLSLNLPLQQAAEQLLDERLSTTHIDETSDKPLPVPPGGAIVALDVRTGAVLVAASAPRFDLALFSGHDQELWQRVRDDPRKPLFHRAAAMALPPGSVFKVVSAIAGLESGRLDPERQFSCQGFLDEPDRYRCFTFRNFGVGHGNVDLVSALARSCNVYFFSAARRIGAEPLQEWAGRFGLGQLTGIDLPGESAGRLPPLAAEPDASARPRAARRSSGDALQLAIGQGKLAATPLQVARLMAAIANGGRLVTPRLAESPGSAQRASDAPVPSSLTATDAERIPQLSSRSLEWVRRGMQQVVSHPQGTGYKTVRLKSISIAGKTGTAEPGGGRPDHAWFAGYVPADRPRIAFVVVLENAGPGGHAAGPVARELVQAAQALGLVDVPLLSAPSAN